MELNAGVEIAPAMNGDDLQKGLSQVGVRRAEARLCPREGISMPLYMYQASCTARFRLQVPLHEVRVIALGEPAHAERHCGGPVAAQPSFLSRAWIWIGRLNCPAYSRQSSLFGTRWTGVHHGPILLIRDQVYRRCTWPERIGFLSARCWLPGYLHRRAMGCVRD